MNTRLSPIVPLLLVSIVASASGCPLEESRRAAEAKHATSESPVKKPAVAPETAPPGIPATGTGPGGPPKPPIIIDPGTGGEWTISAQNAVSDSTMTDNKLNECAFGTKSSFYAVVETAENPNRQVSLVAAVAKFGDKTLDVSVDGTGQFVWRLDNVVLVPYRPASMAKWRPDLMIQPSWIQLASFDDLQQPYTVKGVGTKASGTCLNP